MTESLLFRNAQLVTQTIADIAVVDGGIINSGDHGPITGPFDRVIDLDGRAVAPAFRDDHLHIMAVARSLTSVDLSPESLRRGGGLRAVLQNARDRLGDGWIRGLNYDVAAHGPLNRNVFRELGVAGPIRVQDRTGILWMLDDVGWAALQVETHDLPGGAELLNGQPTGVLNREDVWLRNQLHVEQRGERDLDDALQWSPLRQLLPSLGLVALTDAGATNTEVELALLGAAELPCAITAMTQSVDVNARNGITLGPVKVLLDDDNLPDLAATQQLVINAHRVGRSVALHAVTPTQIAFALNTGIDDRDRIEHGSQVPDGLLEAVQQLGAQVTMQPGMLWTRGDRYLEQVPPDEHHELHRVHTLMNNSIPVRFSSDAPYGPLDPLVGIRSAVDRRTSAGRVVGAHEAIRLDQAIERYGVNSGSLPSGSTADIVVMTGSWFDVMNATATVGITIANGAVIFGDLNRFG